MAQLPLPLRLARHASFDSFVTGSNATALEHVRAVACGERQESVWLCGATGVGKSHLLAAGCRAAGEAGLRPIYLALDPATDPGLIEELERVDLIALDDLDRVCGRPDWERALFALLDARLARGGLLLAAAAPPRDTGFDLADLRSRASAAAVYRLSALDDADLLQAVLRQAEARGLAIDTATATYLLQRASRNLAVLGNWLERIDRYSLVNQRSITRPLIREVLAAADDVTG